MPDVENAEWVLVIFALAGGESTPPPPGHGSTHVQVISFYGEHAAPLAKKAET
jgi:hypothetical protein